MIQKAKALACVKHKGQKRTDGRDYVEHPIEVYKILETIYNEPNRENVLVASILHDTLEDTNTSIMELENLFNEEVASLVVEVTSAKYAVKTFGKVEYLSNKMMHMTDGALAIKLADRLSNVSDAKGYSEERKERLMTETSLILKNIVNRQNLKPYHKKLIEEIGRIILKNKSK